jgi:methyl-accepting chemotaxis protein
MKTPFILGTQASSGVLFWSLLAYRTLVIALLLTTSFFSFKVYQSVSQKAVSPDQVSFKLRSISNDIGEIIEGVRNLSSEIEDQKMSADQAADSASEAANSASEAAEACGDLRFR